MRKEYKPRPSTHYGPFERMANAVVLQAVKDYRSSCKTLKRHPDRKTALKMKAECERFFRSKHFSRFTELNGKLLLKKLQKEVSAHDVG